MTFFSFSLQDDSFYFLSEHLKPNLTYYSKNIVQIFLVNGFMWFSTLIGLDLKDNLIKFTLCFHNK